MVLAAVAAVGGGVIGLAYLYRKRLERTFGTHDTTDEENVEGKIVVVTGANTGLGLEASYEFAKRGATVIMACRDTKRAEDAIKIIRNRTARGELSHGRDLYSELQHDNNCDLLLEVPMKMDLASLDSIREFAKTFASKYDKIHILVNNAGVFVPRTKKMVTQEGYEIHFGVNHLGHFLLTNLLLDKLKKGAPGSRIVMVASTLSEGGKIDFEDLMLEKAPIEENAKAGGNIGGKVSPYGNSKLANILFARELAKRLSGTGVHTYALCPGWVKTDLARYMDLTWKNYVLMLPAVFMFMRSPQQGVQTILHCSVSRQTANETGKLYRNCDHWVTKSDLSEKTASKLWEESEKLVKLA